jgi:DNA-binding NtrC family response regulator
MSIPTILIVEDEAIVSADIAGKLRKMGYEVAGSTDSGEAAVEITRRLKPSLVLMDIRLAGAMDGTTAADVIRRECQVPVVFLTAHSDKATIQNAKQAVAFGYILKPFDDRELNTQIEMALTKHAAEVRLRESEEALQKAHDGLERQVAERTAELVLAMEEAEKRKQTAETALSEIKKLKEQLEGERAYLQEEIKLDKNHENIIGQSEGLKYVLYKVEQIAGSNTLVLILGETGTGKELVARAIHGLSPRKNRALVKVNCAALPSNLIESELFGHEKGAFTGAQSRRAGRFEIANGATLFLDEIGELPLELQGKLLRVIQDGEFERLGSSRTMKVDVRVIAATNRNLEEEVRNGRFREDLWYRLNVFPITMPPLRDRRDDIPIITAFYVKKISKRMGKAIEMIPENIMNALQQYHWPGNIRELENVLERAVINSSGPKLHLVDELKKSFKDLSTSPKTLEAVERDHILRMLEKSHWKVGGKNSAAEILGLDRSTLRARMRKLGIQKP